MTSSAGSRAAALVASCHPVPTVAVTLLATVLVVSAENTVSVVIVAAIAVLSGQLAIGWSNDALDAPRDRLSGRTDKPVARGAVTVRTTWIATAAALVVTALSSAALGWRAGALQLSVVVCGGLYNGWLKATWASPLPFLVAFGGLPAVATLALSEPQWPPAWTLAAAGLIGVAAHFGNVLPDLDDDRRTGISGLPHRLGRPISTLVAIGAAVTAALVAVVAEADGAGAVLWVLAGVALALGAVGLVLGRRRPQSEAPFFATMAIAATGVAMIVASHALV